MPKISPFWAAGGKRQEVKAWAERDEQLRREHWQGKVPAELIGFEKWRKLPKHRRDAIERDAYRRGIE